MLLAKPAKKGLTWDSSTPSRAAPRNCVIPVTSHIGHFSHKEWWPKKSAEPDKGFPWTRQRFADRKLVA